MVNVKLLNDLVQDIPMENFVSTNPEHIIMFIEFLIKQAINTNEQGEYIGTYFKFEIHKKYKIKSLVNVSVSY